MMNRNIYAVLICVFIYAGYYIGQLMGGTSPMYFKIGQILTPFFVIFSIYYLTRNPFLGLLILLFIRPIIGPLNEYSFLRGISLLGLFSVMNIVIAVYVLMSDKKAKLFPENLKLFYAYFIIAGISVLNSPDKYLSILTLVKLLSLLALFLLGYNLPKSFEDALKIMRVLLLSAVIPIIYGIYQKIMGLGVANYQVAKLGLVRITSFFPLGNTFAYFLGLIIIISVFCIFYSNKKQNIVNILILTGALACLVFTLTRTVWVTIFFTTMFIGIYQRKARKWILMSVFAFMIISYDYILLRFADLFVVPEYGYNSWIFRGNIYSQLLLNAVPGHLFVGHGIGSASIVASEFTIYDMIPHNDFIRVVIETGIIGLILYVSFLGNMFFHLLRLIHNRVNAQSNTLFLAFLVFYILVSMGQNVFTFISGSGYIFCLMGIAQKMSEISSENEINI